MKIHNKKSLNLNDIYYDKDGNPIFGLGCLKEKVICLRPSHKSGIPQIYAEFKNNKIISHNYGHSGNGYSLLFGSVEKSIENFQKLRFEKEIGFIEEIIIIGLGAMGLVTALTLYFRGFTNIKIIGEEFVNIPSFWAGGLIEFSLTDVDKNNLEYLNNLFKHTFIEYQNIVKGEHKFIKYGVKQVDLYADFYQKDIGIDNLAKLGIASHPEKLLLKLGNNKPFEIFNLKTFNVSTATFMNSLLYTVKKLKIPIENKKIKSFDEVNSKIIFNCTGLGSRELNNDKNLYPICGHGFNLIDEAHSDIGFMLRLKNIPGLKDSKVNGPMYFMPKSSGFIGGSYVQNYDGKDEKLNNEIINNLLLRSKFIFNEISPVLLSSLENRMIPKF